MFRLRSPIIPHSRPLRLSTGIALLGMLAAPSFAEHLHSDAVRLAPLVVTTVAPRSPSTVVTDPRQPRQPVPASDAADHLRTIPGFAAVRNGGVNGDPVFRGMFGSRIRLLANGGEMLGACPNRMDSPSSYISPESYDRLTVIKGPQTVLWGAGASAATVLFEREPEHFDEPGWRAEAAAVAGSNNRFDRRLDAAAGDDTAYLRVWANRSSADDFRSGDGDRVPSRFNKWNADVAAGWTPRAGTLLELSGGRSDGEARYAGRSMDGSRFLRESLALRLEHEPVGDDLRRIDARIYYNYADHVMDNYSLRSPDPNDPMVMMRSPMAANVDRRTLGGRVAGTWRWGNVELQAGADAQSNEHRERRSMGIGTYRALARNRDAGFHSYGLFGELTRELPENRRLVAGARVDRAFARDYRRQLCNMMGMGCQAHAGGNRADTLPGGFLRYEQDLHDTATLSVGLGHSERFPDYWELFSATIQPGQPTAFESVSPERTTQLDIGVQYHRDDLEAWASAYIGRVSDYILFNYGRGMNPMQTISRVNNINANIAGAEAGATYRFDPHWLGEASLAWAWGENTDDDRAMPQIPPLEARLSLTYEHGAWSVTGLWRLVAAQNRTAEMQGNVAGRDFGDSAGFGVLSLNGAWQISDRLKIRAGIDNLADRNYAEHLNLAGNAGFGYAANERIEEPGRTLWTRIDLTF